MSNEPFFSSHEWGAALLGNRLCIVQMLYWRKYRATFRFFSPFQHRISLINHSVYSFVVELETQICKQMEKKTQQQKEKGKDEGIWGEKESFNRKLNRLELEWREENGWKEEKKERIFGYIRIWRLVIKEWGELPPLDMGWRGIKGPIYSFHDLGRELLLLFSLLSRPGSQGFKIF